MYKKCLFKSLASTIVLVGLLACDEGDIPDSYLTEMPAAAEDLTLMDAVQRQVFDLRCTQCHGGSSHAAADLYLTPGKSRESLIRQPSTIVEGAVRVLPGNHAESLLYRAVADDVSTTWSYNHSTLLTDTEKYLLSTWIDLEN